MFGSFEVSVELRFLGDLECWHLTAYKEVTCTAHYTVCTVKGKYQDHFSSGARWYYYLSFISGGNSNIFET